MGFLELRRQCGVSHEADGETQRHILTVSQSQGPYGPVQTPPYPLPGQGRAESSLAPPRSPSLHLVPSVIIDSLYLGSKEQDKA